MLRLLKSQVSVPIWEKRPKLWAIADASAREVVHHLPAEEDLEELLVSRVGERGCQELITEEAFEELQEAIERGEIATIAQAHRFLSKKTGVHYAHPESVVSEGS